MSKDSDAVAALADCNRCKEPNGTMRHRIGCPKRQKISRCPRCGSWASQKALEASPPTKTLKQVAAEMAESRDNASKQQVSLRKLMKRDKNPTLKLTDRALTAKIQDINWWLYRLAILTTSTDETDGKGGTGS